MEASPGEPPCRLSRPSSFAAPSAKSRRRPSRQQGAPTHRSLYRLPTYLMTLHRIVQPGPVHIFTSLSANLLKALPPSAATSFCQDTGPHVAKPRVLATHPSGRVPIFNLLPLALFRGLRGCSSLLLPSSPLPLFLFCQAWSFSSQ